MRKQEPTPEEEAEIARILKLVDANGGMATVCFAPKPKPQTPTPATPEEKTADELG